MQLTTADPRVQSMDYPKWQQSQLHDIVVQVYGLQVLV